jgi:hypothetical protein
MEGLRRWSGLLMRSLLGVEVLIIFSGGFGAIEVNYGFWHR